MPHVLLIEDDYDSARVTQDLLSALGMDVDTAGDGELALAAMQNGDYDLMLLDLALPGLDGFALLRTAQRLGLTKGTKILVISGVFEPRPAIKQFLRDEDIGAFLPKPFGLIELRAALRRIAPHLLGEAARPAGPRPGLVGMLRQLRLPGEALARGVRLADTAEMLSHRLNSQADLDPRIPCRIDDGLAASAALLTPAFEADLDAATAALEGVTGGEGLLRLARSVSNPDRSLSEPIALEAHVVGLSSPLSLGQRDRPREQALMDAATDCLEHLDGWDVFTTADPVFESIAEVNAPR